ncbi:ferredoxin reductase family protein [Sphingosinicella sp. LHD-64]|uniref:ferredoxin reductase family protein n=1 Tax=Sphingosinicella sp. LHD-64 TaxID=3072139 RepID=UPI00281095D4|nr:ferredoxin reductase family protein [Sphingosinicella sp. LHD-64]MDQ8756204.1 ferredoxin reductase family protein [Sphingosinicella sp. LHD-64]
MSEEPSPHRQLPRRPSSEHLRKQAKRLAKNEDLALNAAQRKLAAQYGAPSWAALMQNVEQVRKTQRPRLSIAIPKLASPRSRNFGLYLMLALAALPVFLPYFIIPALLDNFRDLGRALDLKGRGLATMGLALFALNLVLVARWKLIERWMIPLDQQYRVHHLVGGLALILLVLHPLKMALRYAPESWTATARFLFNISVWQNLLGMVALGLLVTLLGITFFARWRYETWRLSHQWLALPFFIGGLHGLINGLNPILGAYVLLGAAALFWRTILKLYRRHEHVFAIEAVRAVTGSVAELSLRPIGKMPSFAPGQFVFLDIRLQGMAGRPHPFSISSGPGDDHLRFGIKSLGDFTRTVPCLPPGAVVRVEGPFGGFSHLAIRNRRQHWIAGGIGITPFLAMARHLDETEDRTYDVDLHYAIGDEGEAAFLAELSEIARRNPNFRVRPNVGHLSVETLQLGGVDIAETDFLLCGPPLFMAEIGAQLRSLDVSSKHIHFEDFTIRTDETRAPVMKRAVAAALILVGLSVAFILIRSEFI